MTTFAAKDGTSIFEKVWPAKGTPIGTVVLVHGYGEHIQRYEHVAAALNEAGWAVRGSDLRGHGQSGGVRGYCNRFDEYLDDLELLLERAQKDLPGKPVFIVCHSFGAVVAGEYLLKRSAPIAGLVVSSPFYKLKLEVPAVKKIAGKMMSAIYGKMALPSGLKGADVSRDPDIIAIYDRDPLNNKTATARWFTENEAAQADILQRAPELKLPCLFLVGGADKIADPRRAEEVFAKVGSADKTLHVLQGQYHEIFNEIMDERKKTLAMLTSWLKDRHAAASSGKLHAQGS
jgi:alpha-beta hydrolase superfamily lysophospholipase